MIGSRSPTKMEGSKSSENERPDRSVGRKGQGDHDGKDVEERPGQNYDSPYSQTKLNKHEDDPNVLDQTRRAAGCSR